MKHFILASQSPRRKEILETLGLSFEIVVADTDEESEEKNPYRLVELLAERKGRAVYEKLIAEGRALSDTVIISSDTVVAIDGEILGKPKDDEDAKRMLRLYSGRSHEVVSGICICENGVCHASHEVTRVAFDEMDEETIAYYVDTAKPYDKAGAYAIQGLASAYIKGIEGDYFNVVGLPVHRLYRLYFEIFGENIF